MDLEEIKNIIALMKEHELSYFNLESGDTKIKLKRGTDLDALERALHAAAPAAAPAFGRPAAPIPATQTGAADGAAPAPAADPLVEITSPMVGTFYRAPAADADAFVEVGSRVRKDTVVCIIEAMKVMNEIQAETSGTIVEILANNTDPVQFGEPLFRVKPD